MTDTQLDAKKQEFIASGGLNCFHCGSDDLDTLANKEFTDAGIEVSVTCQSCHEEWKELYTLSAIVD